MNKQITRLTLDVGLRDSYKVVFAKMGDTERRVIAEIKDNGEDYSLAGVNTVEVRCRKADGKQVTKNATKDNNTIVIDISGQMTTCKGIAIVDVVLYGTGGGVLSTAKFYLNVDDGAVSEDDIKSSNEYENLTEALRTVGLVKEVADTALNTANTAEEKVEKLLEKMVDFERQGEQIVKNKEDIDSLKEDLNTIRDDLNNITVGGVTSGFVRALQELFSAVAYWDSSKITNPSAKISALSSYIGGGSGNPSGSATVTGIAVVWSATSADVGTDPKTLITSVTAEYSDGTSKVVTSYSVNISSLVLGENNVVVSCLGFTDSKTITGNKVVNSLLSNLRSYKINVLLEPSYTIVSSGNTHTIDWNPDYTGNKIFQNGRAIGNCNIQNGKTYKVSTSEKITDAVHLYGFDVSVSGSEIDDVQSSPGTMVTTFQSGTKEVTFTASADFGYLRLAPVNCPITLYDLVVEEV